MMGSWVNAHRAAGLYAFLLLGIVPAASSAATVTYVGAQLNLGPGWRTPTVAKTQDADGDNVYGTLGYVMFTTHAASPEAGGHGQYGLPLGAVGTLTSLPAYLSVTDAGHADTSFRGDYTLIDDPANPSGPDLWSGLGYKGNASSGVEYPMFTLTFGGATPANSTIRVGLFVDNTAPIGGSPVALRIAEDSPGTGNQQVNKPQATQQNNYYFFDLAGVQPNSTFTVYGLTGPTSGAMVFGGLTFDAVPEPSSLAIAACGLMLLTRRRR